MSSPLHKARILSSENDASVKQNQETNVEINISGVANHNANAELSQMADIKSPVPLANVNFTLPDQAQCAYQYQHPTNNNVRGIADLGDNIESLELKNKFLEALVSIYEMNPLHVNNYLVCHSNSLMELIKLLTNCDKVELVIDDESGCTGCISKHKYLNIQRILVTKDDKTNDLKYGYNDVYAQLVRFGISLKLCV